MKAYERFCREAKASPPKTAALALLLLVGCYFWLPALGKLFDGQEASEQASLERVERSVVPEPSKPAIEPTLHWDEIEKYRAYDVLYKTAAVSELNLNAFKFDRDYLPLEPEFAVESVESKALAGTDGRRNPHERSSPAEAEVNDLTARLSLRSTIIGAQQRAAVINDRVYREGDQFLVNGTTAKLSSVSPRRVTLDADGRTIELQIDPFASKRVQNVR